MDAMDVESRNFKAYNQVPRWWVPTTAALSVLSLVIAIIALSIGSSAFNKASDDDAIQGELDAVPNTSSKIAGRDEVSLETRSDSSNQDTYNAPPGSALYRGYRQPARSRRPRDFTIVVHGNVMPSYWTLLQKGLNDAAKTFHVDVVYFDPKGKNDVVKNTHVIEAIEEAHTNLTHGLAVALLESVNAMGEALIRTSDEIPVVSMLLDVNEYDGIDTSSFGHLGSAYRDAGETAADYFKNAGVQKVLCLRENRVQSKRVFCDELNENLPNDAVEIRAVNPGESHVANVSIINTVQDDNVDAIVMTTTEYFSIAYAYLESLDRLCVNGRNMSNSDCVLLATLDENEEILQGIVDGVVAFALDSQRYLQGFLAVMIMNAQSMAQAQLAHPYPIRTGPRTINNPELAKRMLSRDIINDKTIDGKSAGNYTVRFIVHGRVTDPFWKAVRRGVRFAKRAVGINVQFFHPDPQERTISEVAGSMVTLVNEAVSAKVDAIVTSIPINDSLLIRAIEGAASQGIKIFTMNAGHVFFLNLPIECHIGVYEPLTSRHVREKLVEYGVSKVLCVVPDKGNADLEERCERIGTDGNDTSVEVVILDSHGRRNFSDGMQNGDSRIQRAVVATLREDRTFQAVVSASTTATVGVRNALDELGAFCSGNQDPNDEDDGCFYFVAYDLMPQVFNYIRSGELLFVVDSQPFLQGNLPVHFVALKLMWETHPVGLINTAPKFVNISNVESEETFYGFEYR